MKARIRSELAHVLRIAGPVIMTNFLGFGMNLTDQVFVGHLSKEALAAAAVSNLLYNLPFFFVVGYCTALDTLGAQAYGRRSAASLKAWASTAALHMAVLSVPTCAILLCGQPLAYHLLGQSAEVAAAVGTFCALLAPGALFMALFMVLQKYLQVQNILWPPAVLAFGANLCNIFFNAAFIHWAGLGIVGAPLATTASRILQCLCLWAYILRYHPEPRVPELGDLLDSGEAAQPPAAATVAAAPGDGGTDEVEAGSGVSSGLGGAVFWRAFLYPLAAPVLWLRRRPEWLTHTANRTFLRLGVAGGFMLGLEAWSFEITTAFAATLGTVPLDAHVAQLSLAGFSFVTVPLGVSIASSIRVGNLVGAGDAALARLSSRLSLGVASCFQVTIAIAFILGRHQLGAIFSDSPEVRDAVASIAPVAALFQVTDAFQGVAAGIFRGIGRQTLVAGVNALGFWGIGIPAGALLTFGLGVGLRGLWYGMNVGLLAACSIFVFRLSRIDWEGECQRAARLSDASTPREPNKAPRDGAPPQAGKMLSALAALRDKSDEEELYDEESKWAPARGVQMTAV